MLATHKMLTKELRTCIQYKHTMHSFSCFTVCHRQGGCTGSSHRPHPQHTYPVTCLQRIKCSSKNCTKNCSCIQPNHTMHSCLCFTEATDEEVAQAAALAHIHNAVLGHACSACIKNDHRAHSCSCFTEATDKEVAQAAAIAHIHSAVHGCLSCIAN